MKSNEISNFTLKVKRSTAKRLKKHGCMGDTVDSLINKILDDYEKKSSIRKKGRKK